MNSRKVLSVCLALGVVAASCVYLATRDSNSFSWLGISHHLVSQAAPESSLAKTGGGLDDTRYQVADGQPIPDIELDASMDDRQSNVDPDDISIAVHGHRSALTEAQLKEIAQSIELLTWPGLQPTQALVSFTYRQKNNKRLDNQADIHFDVADGLAPGWYILKTRALPQNIVPLPHTDAPGIRFRVGSAPEPISISICKKRANTDAQFPELNWPEHEVVVVHFSEELSLAAGDQWVTQANLVRQNGKANNCKVYDKAGTSRRAIHIACRDGNVPEDAILRLGQGVVTPAKTQLARREIVLDRKGHAHQRGSCTDFAL